MEEAQGNGKQDFNPRSPHGERPTRAHGGWRTSYFNPRSPHGERHVLWCRLVIRQDFNPRSPHGERPLTESFPICVKLFQSTLPARGATVRHNTGLHSQGISIHAPRTGSDCSANNSSSLRRNFNPRSPHGERHGAGDGQDANAGISIHAPRTGSDASNRC